MHGSEQGQLWATKIGGRFGLLAVIDSRGTTAPPLITTGETKPMSRRLKITLPDPFVAQLEALAKERGEPVARIAAQLVSAAIDAQTQERPSEAITPFADPLTDPGSDRRAPWIEPLENTRTWRQLMWGGICALHGRYPQALAHLKEGWWENHSHVETLCALVVWRDWIDAAADDPRYELAFQAQLVDYGRALRQEGGGVTRIWKPGPAPEQWNRPCQASQPAFSNPVRDLTKAISI